MTFESEGFFSSDMDRFRVVVTSREPTRGWFDFAHEMNRFALEMIRDQDIPPFADNQKFTLTALFIRAHQSCQAALILAERGMIGDARAVLRSATEGVIAMHAVLADPAFVERLTDGYRVNRKKLANVVLGESGYRASYGPEDIAQMRDAVREARELNAQKDIPPINWEQVAKDRCRDVYQLTYRSLSTDGTHTNIDAINRFVQTDAIGRINGFRCGPDAEGIPEVLVFACLTILGAMEQMALAFPSDGTTDHVQSYFRRFQEMKSAQA